MDTRTGRHAPVARTSTTELEILRRIRNSAPESLSNGGADPDTTPMTEPSAAAPEDAAADAGPPK